MKKILNITAGVAASLLLGCGMVNAQAKVDVEGIAKYVYPENAPESPNSFTYLPDGLSYLLLDSNGTKINRYETASGKLIETVLDVTHTRENSVSSIESFFLSPDGTKILLYTQKTPIYRRSFKADWHVFEIKRNILRPLSKQFALQQAPVVSPDGRMVAFVAENNIYIKKIDYDSEVAVTKDGVIDKVINGIPDWTYEEEFSTDCSMVWSPDNTTLCYLRYDEERVPKFSFPLYEGYCNPNTQYALYPGAFSYKYPVAGQQNSAVSIHSYDVETRKIKTVDLGSSSIEYIPRIAFGGNAGEERLMAVTLNRAQNRMEIYAVNPKSTVSKSILVEESKAWLNPMSYEDIHWGATSFVISSERSGWNHMYEYSYAGQQLRQITSGEFDVTGYYGADAQGNIYFQSTAQQLDQQGVKGAISRVIQKIDKAKKKVLPVTPTHGWASATFSPAMNFYVVNYSNESTPPRHTMYNTKEKEVRVLTDNVEYASQYTSLPRKEFFTVPGEQQLNGYIIKPSNFSPGKKYPVIMWQYSGPDSQEVVDRWRMDWDYYAAAERGFVVICVDGRGTGGRGATFRNIVYRNLGYYETIDQIAAARYAASLPFVDAKRIGIAGWSFGGYETLMAISDPSAPYKAAVAIAPVTSWRYYDTVYAERYMLTPGENGDGYQASAPIERVNNVNCSLLMMHGTADDNVHLSNTIEYVSRLQQSGRVCDMLLFPNMNHSINGCNSRALVYGRMIDYFAKNL